MESSFLSEAGVLYVFLSGYFFVFFLFIDKGDFDIRGIREPESELVAMDADFHGIAHGGKLYHGDFRAGNHSHIQQMLPQFAFTAHRFYACALAWF